MPGTVDIYDEIVRLKDSGTAAVLATIVQTAGSSPQREGAKMLVLEDGSRIGTLGGGCLEAEAAAEAARLLTEGGSPRSISLVLTEEQGDLACGGRVLVYIEPIRPAPQLFVIGAGHVGRALATAASFAGFGVTVIDDREEFANPGHLPAAARTVVAPLDDPFAAVRPDRHSYVVVATRGHQYDLEALRATLATEACYIGLLGSRRKKKVLFEHLRAAGVDDAALAQVRVPVGLDIGSVTPEEIAISITAQLVEVRRSHEKRSHRHRACGGEIPADGPAQAAAAG